MTSVDDVGEQEAEVAVRPPSTMGTKKAGSSTRTSQALSAAARATTPDMTGKLDNVVAAYVPCFSYPDGGVGYFIADVAGVEELRDEPRLVCFEVEEEAATLSELLKVWRPDRQMSPLVKATTQEDVDRLVRMKKCEVLYVGRGELTLTSSATEQEVQVRLVQLAAAKKQQEKL